MDTLDNGHVLYRFGGSLARASEAILINKNFLNNVHSYKFISNRIISLRILLNDRLDSNAVVLICCYAPLVQRSMSHPAETDDFYHPKTHVLKKTSVIL